MQAYTVPFYNNRCRKQYLLGNNFDKLYNIIFKSHTILDFCLRRYDAFFCMLFKNILSQRKKFKCWNGKICLCWRMLFYTSMAPDFVYTSMTQKKWTKPHLKVFFEKSLNFRT